jgi:hypothetical protein
MAVLLTMDNFEDAMMMAPVMCRKMLETCEQLVNIFGACKLVIQIKSVDMFWVLFISTNRKKKIGPIVVLSFKIEEQSS